MQVIQAPIHRILLIDDDTDDCFVFEQALQEINPNLQFACVGDCDSVLEGLRKQQPDLIFLDINMPRKTGFDCLKDILSGEEFRKIPVVMYSSSDYTRDINQSYALGASLYFKKPVTVNALTKALKNILEMAWSRPAEIAASHFQNGSYRSYEGNS
ncbi:MAG TPA: response regulator [Flavisolibacter sp.]|jgi:CheY-like chemotaxis protein|nr:response regulator [Flavisolibacter sp.]